METRAALLVLVLFIASIQAVYADIFMHNPRGSNNRNCGGQGGNRDNGNRLFNSNNNAAGGYSCPRAFPFPCYQFIDDATARGNCNGQNDPGNKNMVDRDGRIIDENIVHSGTKIPATYTPRMYYYEGSILPIQWTNQHGSGQNKEVISNIVIQYACDDTLTDSCGEIPAGKENEFPFGTLSSSRCYLRDGFPVNNNNNGDSLNGRATQTIPEDNTAQDDYRYGRHETIEYYRQCRYRKRNLGLWTADQSVSTSNGAARTRQEPSSARYGYECPEERDYYPYWHWTPWKDIVNIVSEDRCSRQIIKCDKCKLTTKESGNVQEKGRCRGCATCRTVGQQPNNARECKDAGGKWVMDPAHGIDKPDCIQAEFTTRVNQLGNGIDGETPTYNWTIPDLPVGTDSMKCVLRIRYNVTPADFDEQATFADSKTTNKIFDDERSEVQAYKNIKGTDAVLALNVNSDEWGRVFQDRSYVFEIRKRPIVETGTLTTTIHNFNIRGKRGNIVQTFPAVEYDFVPNHLTCLKGDAVHIQWTGSDYNPNRNGNNGEGGPVDPQNMGNTLRCDRHNMVQTAAPGDNHPLPTLERQLLYKEETMYSVERFLNKEEAEKMSFLDQDPASCAQIEELRQLYPNDQDARERHHRNCGKLNTRTPYFDGGVVKCDKIGTFHFMSTRDNNFSNRDMKGTIEVKRNFWLIMGLLFGALTLVGASAFFVYRRRKKGKPIIPDVPLLKKVTNKVPKNPFRRQKKFQPRAVTAIYSYEAQEENELSFEKGDTVVITEYVSDEWWLGTCKGEEGVFPRTYVS